MWRNWYTRMIQVHVHASGFGFESRHLHFHLRNNKSYKKGVVIMASKNLITQSGYDKFKKELVDLKENGIPEVTQKIKDARAQGDLSENAEYDAARDEQARINARINEIEHILKHAEVFDVEKADTSVVYFGSTVTFEDVESGNEMVYRIVGSHEVDIMSGDISYESPIGEKLLGKKVGDVVTVNAPNGEIDYRILDFQ